ncbi:MAG: hypothetical protein UU73_C0003G0193 [Candidatus Daviesbacteria bacterium GW2011_GWA1_41_61]|uniref:Prepilin-type N-terminal cleavage/methylation domain-containing protein n=1 Tax=Candidatus Daviesbacteria bacterium GW2011_GWA2_40_9 TaxID=1618424 RepID=A0A0G0U430_9BACT|nr:MAG: hypothetical protein UU26_C0003G0033 [Candidatus Daviesbacteria bacterium GW2011_GWC1_40_9]KKR83848.1 MAG: hypothetical protein UU29_C0001G0068 [Candidatus Daviesbacteria bacterium GW2011_GWA2_40_9]KKR93457.1 MAG: hypothetical protein UU44_C0002G0118 [Candidatus Daviesbacteria bacterium GW2011_GWB1_41_15]KKS14994.1 MAG: hypothetical protein UU73_C0003G0193 [Candidatus Daviesbacteria bacterium GW2011_GWA1_41_61]
MKKPGFTLIELIIVVSIIVLLGLIFTDILVQTLRGQNKVRILNQVKQNGQVVMEKLSTSIRQGGEVKCVGDLEDDSDTIDDTITMFKPSGYSPNQGTYIRFRLIRPVANTTNGYLTEEYFTDKEQSSQGFTDSQLCIKRVDLGFKSYLTDLDTIKGVSVDHYSTDEASFSPLFKKIEKKGYNDAITVTFRLFPGVKVGAGAYEADVKEGGIPVFTTTVQLRRSW